MNIADIFAEELEGTKFSCREDYNAEVLRISNDLSTELGETERSFSKLSDEELINLGYLDEK